MKFVKHLIIYELACIIFMLFLCFELSFIVSGSINTKYESDKNGADSVFTKIPNIKSQVYLNNKSLIVNEEINLGEPTKDIWLNIPANLYSKANIRSINLNNYNVEMLNDNLAMHISVSNPTEIISLEYEIPLEKKQDNLSYSDDKILLTEFLITPAPYVKDKYIICKNSSVGDPFVYSFANYEITLDISNDFYAYAPGEISEKANGIRKSYMYKVDSVRDFPIALIKKPNVIKNKIRDIEITYVNMPDIHNDVVKAFKFIENIACNYPYKELFIINAPVKSQGMEFSQMIFISDNALQDKTKQKKVIEHEVFHQWFYGIIGTDQINEPFMDEGLVSYLVKELNGERVTPKINQELLRFNLTDYKSNKEYYSIVYDDGSALFEFLHNKYKENFDISLHSLFTKFYGKILTYDDFINILEQNHNGVIK